MSRRLDAPRRLLDANPFLSREECAALFARIASFAEGGGETAVRFESASNGGLRWGRNRVTLASDRRDVAIYITRTIRGAQGTAAVNQVDDAALTAAIRAAERVLHYHRREPQDLVDLPVHFQYATPTIWSDATFDLDAQARSRVARTVIEPLASPSLLSAGYLAVTGRCAAQFDSTGRALYAPYTEAQCSITVRDARGTSSGWAGLSSYDWTRIDAAALGARALEKCERSRNPLALEPGRYTVVLEPQAVADLVSFLFPPESSALDRRWAEDSKSPFTLRPGYSKLGLRVTDPRVTLSHDPMDEQTGIVPFDDGGEPYRAVTWIDHGVLTTLSYDRKYALERLNENLGCPNSGSFRMTGGETTIDEMIATTKRGLLVTRFSNLNILDRQTLLLTGVTRDGLWLIENGKITKAVKNFRFTESPLFVLNSIEQLGPSVPVFRPGYPTIVPPLKSRDFSFTSLVDAI
jgi:predicted Zn-dependent protease